MVTLAFPPDLQQFLREEIANGSYRNEEEAAFDAVRMLRDSNLRFQQFRDELPRRVARLERGEGIEIDDDESLEWCFDEIVALKGCRNEVTWRGAAGWVNSVPPFSCDLLLPGSNVGGIYSRAGLRSSRAAALLLTTHLLRIAHPHLLLTNFPCWHSHTTGPVPHAPPGTRPRFCLAPTILGPANQ